ncbi:hypothetical protein QQX98_002334 [Neonectria punicea]|uniref:Uncharacterized protein n=1 Tax=Neonectria punicea TaxID=979145 RepID=A0ABR1HK65_9HYPO
MESHIVSDPNLSRLDNLVLQNLAADLKDNSLKNNGVSANQNGNSRKGLGNDEKGINHGVAYEPSSDAQSRDEDTLRRLQALNDPKDPRFEPSVFNNFDLNQIKLPRLLDENILRPYIRAARTIVRVETDVVMLTHLLLYFSTSVPSALFLFWRFTFIHGVLHFVMQFLYMGTSP